MPLTFLPHPMLAPPSKAVLATYDPQKKEDVAELLEIHRVHHRVIELSRSDPYRHGFEPQVEAHRWEILGVAGEDGTQSGVSCTRGDSGVCSRCGETTVHAVCVRRDSGVASLRREKLPPGGPGDANKKWGPMHSSILENPRLPQLQPLTL